MNGVRGRSPSWLASATRCATIEPLRSRSPFRRPSGCRIFAPRALVAAAVLLLSAPDAAYPADLRTSGTRFTVDGEERFLCGISYFGALGASAGHVRMDLDDVRRFGFDWIRVWATWSAFGHDVSAVDEGGGPREPYLTRLREIVAECDRRGLVVDITLTPGLGVNGPHLRDHTAHENAVRLLCTELKSHRNWFLDLANEHNLGGTSRLMAAVSPDEIQRLRAVAKAVDSARLVTASHIRDLPEKDIRAYVQEVRLDFLAPHRDRGPAAIASVEARTRAMLDIARAAGRPLPVLYQEPFRRDFDRSWQPDPDAFVADLVRAHRGGAAGWCFHNGAAPPGSPGLRRCFDLRERRLFDQLDAVERLALDRLAGALATLRKVEAVSAAPD